MFSSHLTAVNGRVYANNGDQYFIGLDVHTGEEYFKTTTGDSPSKIVYNDNKCYMSDVSTSKSRLMVIDATAGDILYDVAAPYAKSWGEDKKWTFDGVCTVDPETGLVYTADHKYLLVYDFEE